MTKTKKSPMILAKYEVMGPIADALNKAIKKYLKAGKHPFHRPAGVWESPPPHGHLSDFPAGVLVAEGYLIGYRALVVGSPAASSCWTAHTILGRQR